jgi:hypothetical protein
MFYFIFGGSFLGILMSVMGPQFNGPAHSILSIVGAAWVGWFINQRGIFIYFALCGLALAAGIGAEYAMRGLATLATGGVYGPDNSGTGGYFFATNYLIFGILWLIVGIPHRAFKYEFDRDGERNAQDVMVGTLATISTLLAVAFIILLHYGNGPFGAIGIRPLIVGAFAAAFIIFPIFRTIARRCWQCGLFGSLSPRPFIMRLGSAAVELDTATSDYWRKHWENYDKLSASAQENRSELAGTRNSPGRSGSDSQANPPSSASSAKVVLPLGEDTQPTKSAAGAPDASRGSLEKGPGSRRIPVSRKNVQHRRKRTHKRR